MIGEKEYENQVKRLEADDTNRDHHTGDTFTTAAYTNVGNIGELTADLQWTADERSTIQEIATTASNAVFMQGRSLTTVKALACWKAFGAEYQDQMKMGIVDLEYKISNAKHGEDGIIRDNVAQHALVLMDEQLGAMAEIVVDREFAQILISSMPASYANVRTAQTSTRTLT
jgi:hypothetical protein